MGWRGLKGSEWYLNKVNGIEGNVTMNSTELLMDRQASSTGFFGIDFDNSELREQVLFTSQYVHQFFGIVKLFKNGLITFV